jgi:hypothetical protein
MVLSEWKTSGEMLQETYVHHLVAPSNNIDLSVLCARSCVSCIMSWLGHRLVSPDVVGKEALE